MPVPDLIPDVERVYPYPDPTTLTPSGLDGRSPNWTTQLYIWTVLNNVIFRIKNRWNM